MPLIFGTIKATLYAMLIAAPLGLLAALFTSEFLDPKWRNGVKSSLEMMASLPSVVLGFLAALIIAPFVEVVVPAVLVSFLTIPFAVLLGARVWQLLPTRVAVRWSRWQRFVAILVFLPAGGVLAVALGPRAEAIWFGGDIKLWLNGGPGGGMGGWLFLLMPLSIFAVALAVSRFAGPWLRSASRDWSRLTCALVDIGKFVGMAAASLLVATLAAKALGAAGIDPRGGIFDTYAQRNALILGFVMGFAVVPVIYTIAEDALSSVPQALREGSLGAGATPWQTAWRIVIPTAMSGLFGAMMVGLGRAVGETMIVLMAAGNTPIMEWNIFNGFRTLSANIAVELPEAVKDDTHYRALFLAALVLFAMTFLVNTLAEMVRRAFRKKFAEL
jgi:phosphate transport system permease protein